MQPSLQHFPFHNPHAYASNPAFSFCCATSNEHFTVMSDAENSSQQQEQTQGHEGTESIDNLLQDPTKRAELIRKSNSVTSPLLTPCRTAVEDGTANLTSSGMSVGGGAMPPMWPFGPFFPPQLALWPLRGGQGRRKVYTTGSAKIYHQH